MIYIYLFSIIYYVFLIINYEFLINFCREKTCPKFKEIIKFSFFKFQILLWGGVSTILDEKNKQVFGIGEDSGLH